MTLIHSKRVLGASALFSLALSAASCGKDAQVQSERGLAITVQPLTLRDIDEAIYSLTVKSAEGVVWSKSGLRSTQYGDGRGALTYIGTCDASANPHSVELVLEGLYDGAVEVTEFANPAPPGRPVIKANIDCQENADTPVTFNLTIARDADQGFFDVGVNFSDIFCSAKVDCLDNPLLHIPGGERGPTAVMAFACTTGQDSQGNAENTYLHFTNVVVECGPVGARKTYTVSPPGAPGNLGAVSPVFFQTALYQGQEELPGFDKCYWNMAFGVNEALDGDDAIDCRLIAQATASDTSWTANGGSSPADSVYPYVNFDVTITDGQGDLDCGSAPSHPLDGPGSSVTTTYTSFEGGTFTHEWECGTTTVTTEKLACSGLVAGQTSAGSANFVQTPAGVQVAFGNSWSQLYELPGQQKLDDCCMNPCCTVP